MAGSAVVGCVPGLVNKSIQNLRSARLGADASEQIRQQPEVRPGFVSLPVAG